MGQACGDACSVQRMARNEHQYIDKTRASDWGARARRGLVLDYKSDGWLTASLDFIPPHLQCQSRLERSMTLKTRWADNAVLSIWGLEPGSEKQKGA